MQLRSREQQYRAVYPSGSFQLVLLHSQLIGRVAIDRSVEPWSLIDIAFLPEYRGHRLGTHVVQNLLCRPRSKQIVM